MTDTSRRPEPGPGHAEASTAWTGWVVFAGLMMVLLGIFQVVQGIVALASDDFYLVGRRGLVVDADFTVWGWTHVVLGLVAGLVGVGLLAGSTVARVGGVVIAVLDAVVNLVFMSAYPLWLVLVITLDVIVIYAITVHGGELKAESY
jgi:hypothetical protein